MSAPRPDPRVFEAARRLREQRPSVLIAVAHPDDAELFFGAAMLRWRERGARIFLVVATSGGKFGEGGRSGAAVARLREAEQRQAAALAGAAGVFFLGLPDGEVSRSSRRLEERLVFYARKLRPRVLCSFDPGPYSEAPGTLWIKHPDHRAVGEAALFAASFSGLASYFPAHSRRGLTAWPVREVLLADSVRPNFSVDARPFLEGKRKLLAVYRSQELSGLRLPARERFLRLVRPGAR